MKNDGWIGPRGLRYWYYRYRDSQYYAMAIIGATILACFLLFMYVIIPQFTEWFSIRKQVIETRARISILEDNIAFINSLDQSRLNKQLTTAMTALPAEKDFGSMLTIMSQSAVQSGVSLSDYSFQVGSIASASGVLVESIAPGVDAIRVTVVVNGNLIDIQEYISVLEKSLPLSEITSIEGSGQNVSVSLQFFQKPFPNVQIPDTEKLKQLSDDKAILLQELSQWNVPQENALPTGSASAVPLF